ncbi:MAG: hypothetical protein ABSC56_04945 [Solirubrobacteraceae bacterium]|jgi:hypothetical protein
MPPVTGRRLLIALALFVGTWVVVRATHTAVAAATIVALAVAIGSLLLRSASANGDQPPESDSGAAISTTGGSKAVRVRSRRSGLSPGITAALSLAALVGGIALRSHYQSMATICNSSLGTLGQSVDAQAQSTCTTDSTLAIVGLVLLIVGGLCLVSAVLALMYSGQKGQGGGGWKPLDPPK